MKNKFFLLFILLAIKCSAQIRVYAPENEVRLDVATYFYDYPTTIERLGYDSLDANGLVIHGSYLDADSLITGAAMRTSYKYDEAGRKVSYKAWKDLNGTKKIFTNEQISYTATGKILTYKVVIHGNSVEHIDSISKSHYDSLVYDAKDSLLFKFVKYPDASGNWQNGLKYYFAYFPDGKLRQSSSYKWENEQWSIYQDLSFRYSTAAFVDSTIINNSKILLTFKNIFGKDSVKMIQVVDSGKWVNDSKHSYIYSTDSLSSMLQIVSYAWSKDSLDWDPWPFLSETWKHTTDMKLLEYTLGNFNFNFLYYTYYPDGRIKTEKYGYQINAKRRYSSHFYSYKKIELPPIEDTFDFTINNNPTIASISALLYSKSKQTGSLFLYNSIGQLVKSETLEIPEGYIKIEIPIKDISKGFYFLTISAGEQVKTKKIMIAE